MCDGLDSGGRGRRQARPAIWCLVTLLQLLALSASNGALARQPSVARLPQNLADWRYALLSHKTSARSWTRMQLDRAVRHAEPDEFAAFFDKLHRGERVVVVSLGSSIVANQGGTFGPLAEVSKVVRTVHENHFRVGPTDNMYGWMNSVMDMLNQTWPQNHLLINLGRPGLMLTEQGRAICFDHFLPNDGDLDLIVLDNHDKGILPLAIEVLLWRLLSRYTGKSRPAVLFVNFNSVDNANAAACIRAAYNPGNPKSPPHSCDTPACSVKTGSFNYSMSNDVRARSMEDAMQPMLEYYGITSLSMRNLFHSVLRDRQLLDNAPSECHMLASFYMDAIHFRPRGVVLVADVVLHMLSSMERLLYPEAHADGLPARLPPPRLLPDYEYYSGARTAFVMRCYGEAHEDVNNQSSRAAHAFKVVSQSGFQYHLYQLHGMLKKFKPGWVSLQAGSEIQFEVSTLFPEAAPNRTTSVAIYYLRSYQHMGKAVFDCVSGCKCAGGLVVDAHKADEKVSIAVSRSLNGVTQNEECVVRVRVLNETSSDEHKFKVISIVVLMEEPTLFKYESLAHVHAT